jgi:hypothetical protein
MKMDFNVTDKFDNLDWFHLTQDMGQLCQLYCNATFSSIKGGEFIAWLSYCEHVKDSTPWN